MKRFVALTTGALVALVVVSFAGDYLLWRYKVSPYGSVEVQEYYAIQEKNNRTEYRYKGAEQRPCVHSLFGHSGCLPCWYLQRHREQQIPI